MTPRYPSRSSVRLVAPLVVAAFVFAACGGSSDTSTTEPADTEPASTTTSPLFVRNESSSEDTNGSSDGQDGTSSTESTIDSATTIPDDGTTTGATPPTTVAAGGQGQPSNAAAAVLTAAELEAAGLGTDWTQDVEVLTSQSDRLQDDNVCRSAEINVPGAVYADSVSDQGAEFEQVIGVGNGLTGVEVYGAFATCPEFLVDFDSDVKTLTVSVGDATSVAGATSATAFEVQDGADVRHWYAANFGGDLIAISYVGDVGSAGPELVKLLELAASRL